MGERFKYHELFKKWQAWRDPDELVAEYEKYEAAQTQLKQLQALVRALPEPEEGGLSYRRSGR